MGQVKAGRETKAGAAADPDQARRYAAGVLGLSRHTMQQKGGKTRHVASDRKRCGRTAVSLHIQDNGREAIQYVARGRGVGICVPIYMYVERRRQQHFVNRGRVDHELLLPRYFAAGPYRRGGTYAVLW